MYMPIHQASLFCHTQKSWLVVGVGLMAGVWVWRLISTSTNKVMMANIPQNDKAVCQGKMLMMGVMIKPQNPANKDMDKLKTPVARAMWFWACFLIKGAVRAFNNPMASDKISVPTNKPPTPSHTRAKIATARVAVLIVIMRSSPKRLARLGATNAPRANMGMGNAPSMPMADMDSDNASANVGAIEPIITMGDRMLMADTINMMINSRGVGDFVMP